MRVMIRKLSMGLVALSLLLILMQGVMAQEVTRVFPGKVKPGAKVTVELSYPENQTWGMNITETFPEEFTYVSRTLEDANKMIFVKSGNQLNFIVIDLAKDDTGFKVEYTLKAPETTGVYSFSGTYEVFTERTKDIGGLETIKVTEEAGPPPVDGNTPKDVNQDSLYEDTNGDNSFNFGDVIFFFKHFDSNSVKNNKQFYDFNGDGVINFGDVIGLFKNL